MAGYTFGSEITTGSGWVTGLGVIKTGGKTVVCFSRPLRVAAARRRLQGGSTSLMPSLDATGVGVCLCGCVLMCPAVCVSSISVDISHHGCMGCSAYQS